MRNALFFEVLATAILAFAAGCGGNNQTSTGTGGSTTGTGGTTTGAGGTGGSTTSTGGSATSTGGTGGTGGSTTTGTAGGGACDAYQGQAPKADIAQSPFANEEAEVLAIEASGKVVAPLHIYERILADLALIRGQSPQVKDIAAQPSWAPQQLLLIFDAEGQTAVMNGTYTAWDCPNAWYGFKQKMVQPSYVLVQFDHRFHMDLLGQEYAKLEHVTSAEPNGFGGDGSDVCVSIDNDVYSYVFDAGSGDCPAGCITHQYWGFSTKGTPATVTPLGSFTTPMQPPAWYTALSECTKWL